MEQYELFKIHNFLKKHTLVQHATVNDMEVCSECGMVFHDKKELPTLSTWKIHGKERELAQYLPLYPADVYESAFGVDGLVWLAARTGDQDGQIARMVSKTDNPGTLLKFARLVGHKDCIASALILSDRVNDGYLIQYCESIGRPIAVIRDSIKNKHSKQGFFRAVDNPYYTKLIQEAKAKKLKLWEQMKPAFKDTRAYKSEWYIKTQHKHKCMMDLIKAYKKTREELCKQATRREYVV